MKEIGIYTLLFSVLTALFFATDSYAEKCFDAANNMKEDAEAIRLKAWEMGWKVGKPSSFTAATLVKSKAKMYPESDIEVCLCETDDNLQIKVQSKSEDALKAGWHNIRAKRKTSQ